MTTEDFVRESNRIEGIHEIREGETAALDAFLYLVTVHVPDLVALVKVFQPDAKLRDRPGMDVRVGSYYPPKGGPLLPHDLDAILFLAKEETPFLIHKRYEALHPFTDGNGRSGRALWLRMMFDQGLSVRLGFLHTWYYQSLDTKVD